MGTSQRRGRFRLRDDTSPQGRRGRGPPGCAFQEPPPISGPPTGPCCPRSPLPPPFSSSVIQPVVSRVPSAHPSGPQRGIFVPGF